MKRWDKIKRATKSEGAGLEIAGSLLSIFSGIELIKIGAAEKKAKQEAEMQRVIEEESGFVPDENDGYEDIFEDNSRVDVNDEGC